MSISELGFPQSYNPPEPNYNEPLTIDPNFKNLQPTYVDPYWIDALVMDSGEIITAEILELNDKVFMFSFPSEVPDYLPLSIAGWAPANEKIKDASREIFQKLEQVLDIKFKN